MKYLSLFSGIEAVSVAWSRLGWKASAFAEIEPFPCAVLSHRFPGVPNLGDVTKLTNEKIAALGPIDIVVGGSPCQSFSVAGLRKGMDDPRGNLALEFLRVVDCARPRWMVFENVPGLLSSSNGRDFGFFLGALGQLGYGWAYRVLDAQYAGVPQRRRRVFVVGCLGDWHGAAAVLFERHCLSGNPPPRRQAGAGIAGCVTDGSYARGATAEQAAAGHLIAGTLNSGGGNGGFRTEPGEHLIVGTLNANGKAAGSATQQDAESGLLVAYGGNNCAGPIDVATAMSASGSPHGRLDFESETFIVHTLRGKANLSHRACTDNLVCHSLRAEGFDASEYGTGRGTPLVAVAVQEDNQNGVTIRDTAGSLRSDATGTQPCGSLVMQPIPIDMRQASRGATMTNNRSEGVSSGGAPGTGIGEAGDPSPTVASSHVPAVAGFQWQQSGDTQMGYTENGSPPLRKEEINAALSGMAVRRLTPLECERLQGFPDGYTAVPFNGKPAADGPRYRSLGNSMCVNVLDWIGRRIQLVDEAMNARKAVPQ